MSNSSSNGAADLRRVLSKTGALIRGRMGAIQWLIICGAALVLAIALGTAYLALEYRERAIKVGAQMALFRRLRSVSVLRISTRNFPNCMKE